MVNWAGAWSGFENRESKSLGFESSVIRNYKNWKVNRTGVPGRFAKAFVPSGMGFDSSSFLQVIFGE